ATAGRRGEHSRCRRSRDAPRGVSTVGPGGSATFQTLYVCGKRISARPPDCISPRGAATRIGIAIPPSSLLRGMAARIRARAGWRHPLSQTAPLSRPRVEEDTTMRIFIAGATGTLGRPVVRLLVSLGHEVVGLTRTEKGARALEAAGARGVIG